MVNQEGIPWFFPYNKSHREWECPRNQDYEEEEDPNSYEHMNLVEDMDHIYAIPRKTYIITNGKMELSNKRVMMPLV